nr:MAG TPA: hypothetical protein [Caudoviricetes sp.]
MRYKRFSYILISFRYTSKFIRSPLCVEPVI